MTIRLLIITLFTLAQLAHAGEAKAIIIGIDGLRSDCWTAAKPLPAFDALKAQAAWSDTARTARPTISGPCWSSILCGVGVQRHLVVDNSFNNNHLDAFPTLFRRLTSARSGLRTACIVAWEPINKHLVQPAASVTRNHPATDAGDDAVTKDAVALIQGGETDLIFLQLDTIDGAGHGHGYGPASKEYLEAIRRMDGRVGQITTAIDERRRQRNEDWLIIAVSDHGGINKGHGGDTPEESTVFLWVSGGTAIPGPITDQTATIDIAPTVAAHLRIPVDTAWGWEGRARGLKHAP